MTLKKKRVEQSCCPQCEFQDKELFLVRNVNKKDAGHAVGCKRKRAKSIWGNTAGHLQTKAKGQGDGDRGITGTE